MNEVGRSGKSRPIRLAVQAILKQSISAPVSRHRPFALCLRSAAEYGFEGSRQKSWRTQKNWTPHPVRVGAEEEEELPLAPWVNYQRCTLYPWFWSCNWQYHPIFLLRYFFVFLLKFQEYSLNIIFRSFCWVFQEFFFFGPMYFLLIVAYVYFLATI